MSLGKDDPPTPPNPVATAGTQTATNVSTALANAFLNNTGQNTPLGSLSYDVTGNYNFTDPSTGTGYNIPRFTANQTLSPSQQGIQDQSQAAKYNLAALSNTQSGQLNSLLGSPIDLSNAPAAGDPNSLAPTRNLDPYIWNSMQQRPTFDDAGQITRTYGPADDFSSDRSRVEQSLYGRLNPQLQLEQKHIEQQLADQGIRYGSPAYTNAMDSYNRQANDARLAVTQTAGQEQQRLMDMAAKRAGFQNAAQQQAYEQAIGRGTFYNMAQKDEFSQFATRSQLWNNTIAQQQAMQQAQLNAQNAARGQYLSEQYALRDQPINQISALLSGSQVQQPNFLTTPSNQIPTTDVAGLINQNFNQNLDIFKQQSASQNALLGGLFGFAGNVGAGFARSDERVKENIHRIGTVFSSTAHEGEEPPKRNERKKLPIYDYSYKDDPSSARHTGPMAQDVEKIDPGAVRTFSGVKHINVPRVMGSILKAA